MRRRLSTSTLVLALLAAALGATGCKDRTDDLVVCECLNHTTQFGRKQKAFCKGEANNTPDLCSQPDYCGASGGTTVRFTEDGCKSGFRWWLRRLLEGSSNDIVEAGTSTQFLTQATAERSPDSPYRGRLVESGAETSRGRVKRGTGAFAAADPWFYVRGDASLAGELCPEGSCAIQLEWLDVQAKTSFNVIGSGDTVSGFNFMNFGPWVGYKSADGSFYFQQSSAITAGGVVNGRSVAANVSAAPESTTQNQIRGRILWTNYKPMLTINGVFTDGKYTMELDIAFNLNDAGPAASITTGTSARCTGNALMVYEGHADSLDYSESQIAMAWYDQTGRRLSTNRCLYVQSCDAGKGPVTLVATDPAGRVSTAQYFGAPVLGAPKAYEYFGWSVAVGDFNGDGFGDVLAGSPGDKVDGEAGWEQGLCGPYCWPDWDCPQPSGNGGGAVLAMYGTVDGITPREGQFFSQNSPGVAGGSEPEDNMGYAVAVGDFDADGYQDAAVGAPGEKIVTDANEGMIHVLYGSQFGLKPDSTHTDAVTHNNFRQGAGGVPDTTEVGDAFGRALAAGDFDGDGVSDLAVGAPGEDSSAGAVTILYGVKGQGLVGAGSTVIRQSNIAWGNEPGDAFGAKLAAGDLNHDGYDELVIGSTGENNVGAVIVLYGSDSGPRLDAAGRWSLVGAGTYAGSLGSAFAIGDFDGDFYNDLAMGAPRANANAGAVVLVSGTADKLNSATRRVLRLGVADPVYGTLPTGGANAMFGQALAAGYYDSDSKSDLMASAPNGVIGNAMTGFTLLMRSFSGSVSTFSDANSRETGDAFGLEIASADIDRNGRSDIVFGVPGQRAGNFYHSGKIAVQQAPDIHGRGASFKTFTQNTVADPPPERELPEIIVW